MDTWWIDYSAKKLSAATIAGTPVGLAGEYPSGVIRYIDEPIRLGTKHTNKAEWDDHGRAGLGRALFFEVNKNDPLGGYAQGQAYARRAQAGADHLGYTGPIFFCCDRWMNEAGATIITAKAWQAYLDGAVSVLGRDRVGAYGFADAMDAALGHVDLFVQCGSRKVLRSFVHAWQDNNVQPIVGGIQTDRLLILKSISQEDDDMTPEEIQNAVRSTPIGQRPDGSEVQLSDMSNVYVDTYYPRSYDSSTYEGSSTGATVREILRQVDALHAQQTGLIQAITALSDNPELSKEAITEIITDAIAAALQDQIHITGTVEIGGVQ